MPPASIPELIYKIASRDVADVADRNGTFTGMPIDLEDGYLHFSTAAQLRETLRRYFAGQGHVVLLALRASEFELRWEPSRGGDLFPHLYGTFPIAAAVHRATIDVPADGEAVLPEWVR